jgi:hypothetical protein
MLGEPGIRKRDPSVVPRLPPPRWLNECSAKRASQGHGEPTRHIGPIGPVANADCAIERRSHQPERTGGTPGWDMPTQVSGGVGTLLIAPS